METTESLRADWQASYYRTIYQSKRDGKGFSFPSPKAGFSVELAMAS